MPATALADMLFSASIFAAAGIAIDELAVDAGAAAVATGAAEGAAVGEAVGAAALALAVASVSIRAINSPATTLLPSPLTISINTPCAGAGSSNTTLSVSISIRFSSRAMASPTFLCHCNKVASATDSDNCGTTTSRIAITLSVSGCSNEAPASSAPSGHYLVSTKPFSLENAVSIKAFNWA